MKKTINILSSVFVFQLILVGALSANWGDPEINTNQSMLGKGLVESLTQLEITEDEKGISLAKSGDGWTLPEHNDLPVAPSKIDSVLEDLGGLKKTWPIAQTKSAAERFEVAEDKFKKRIQLNAKDDSQNLYVGTSPSFRKSHLRLDEEDEIYSGELATHDLSLEVNDWLDKSLLKLKKDKFQSVALNELNLTKEDNQWTLSDLGENEELVQEQLDKAINFASNLSVSGVLDKEKVKEWQDKTPSFSLTVDDGSKNTYDVYIKESESVIKSSLRDEWFSITKFQVEALADLSRESLVKAKVIEPAETKTENVEEEIKES